MAAEEGAGFVGRDCLKGEGEGIMDCGGGRGGGT